MYLNFGGGALSLSVAYFRILNCKAGGIYLYDNRAFFSLRDVYFDGNARSSGGSLYVYGHATSDARYLIQDAEFWSGEATTSRGGNIYCNRCSNALLSNVTIRRGVASLDGGNAYFLNSANITFDNAYIRQGVVPAAAKGSNVYFQGGADVTWQGTTQNYLGFGANGGTTGGQGGGAYFRATAGSIVIQDMTVYGNDGGWAAGGGGGGLQFEAVPADITIRNSYFAYNDAHEAGALLFKNSNGEIVLENLDFFNNDCFGIGAGTCGAAVLVTDNGTATTVRLKDTELYRHNDNNDVLLVRGAASRLILDNAKICARLGSGEAVYASSGATLEVMNNASVQSTNTEGGTLVDNCVPRGSCVGAASCGKELRVSSAHGTCNEYCWPTCSCRTLQQAAALARAGDIITIVDLTLSVADADRFVLPNRTSLHIPALFQGTRSGATLNKVSCTGAMSGAAIDLAFDADTMPLTPITFRQLRFENCDSRAIYIYRLHGVAFVVDEVDFYNCDVSSGNGGAYYHNYVAYTDTAYTLRNTWGQYSQTNGWGGIVYIEKSTNLLVETLDYSYSTAAYGGCLMPRYAYGNVVLKDLNLHSCDASVAGHGLWIGYATSIEIGFGSTFAFGGDTLNGGYVVYAHATHAIEIDDCFFQSNLGLSGSRAGALYVRAPAINITNSAFRNNRGDRAGDVHALVPSGTGVLWIESTRFESSTCSNVAGCGANIYFGGTSSSMDFRFRNVSMFEQVDNATSIYVQSTGSSNRATMYEEAMICHQFGGKMIEAVTPTPMPVVMEAGARMERGASGSSGVALSGCNEEQCNCRKHIRVGVNLGACALPCFPTCSCGTLNLADTIVADGDVIAVESDFVGSNALVASDHGLFNDAARKPFEISSSSATTVRIIEASGSTGGYGIISLYYASGVTDHTFTMRRLVLRVIGSGTNLRAFYSFRGATHYEFEDVRFENGITTSSGANLLLIMLSNVANQSVTLNNVHMIGGAATSGGAFSCSNCGNVFISDSSFTNSTAQSDGGGISIYSNNYAQFVNVTRTTFVGNAANGQGGGLYVFKSNSIATVASRIVDCVFEENHASIGGGLSVTNHAAFLDNVTFTKNTCDDEESVCGSMIAIAGEEEMYLESVRVTPQLESEKALIFVKDTASVDLGENNVLCSASSVASTPATAIACDTASAMIETSDVSSQYSGYSMCTIGNDVCEMNCQCATLAPTPAPLPPTLAPSIAPTVAPSVRPTQSQTQTPSPTNFIQTVQDHNDRDEGKAKEAEKGGFLGENVGGVPMIVLLGLVAVILLCCIVALCFVVLRKRKQKRKKVWEVSSSDRSFRRDGRNSRPMSVSTSLSRRGNRSMRGGGRGSRRQSRGMESPIGKEGKRREIEYGNYAIIREEGRKYINIE